MRRQPAERRTLNCDYWTTAVPTPTTLADGLMADRLQAGRSCPRSCLLLRTVLFIILLSCLRSDIVILYTLIVFTYLLTVNLHQQMKTSQLHVLRTKILEKRHYHHTQLSHILTNISKQHIFNYITEIDIFNQWHRSVVKYRGSGSVRSSHQTVSDYTLRQWFPNA